VLDEVLPPLLPVSILEEVVIEVLVTMSLGIVLESVEVAVIEVMLDEAVLPKSDVDDEKVPVSVGDVSVLVEGTDPVLVNKLVEVEPVVILELL
jgi:hypothetical protein